MDPLDDVLIARTTKNPGATPASVYDSPSFLCEEMRNSE